jgi:hypothetical protein
MTTVMPVFKPDACERERGMRYSERVGIETQG